MTEPQDNMPLGQLDAIDPYPFHGLVYFAKGDFSQAQILDPRDGRPHVSLPFAKVPVHGISFPWAQYAPRYDGCLWDIGRPDPPVTPAIFAASATALGKRIVNRLGVGPVRLGERTAQVEVVFELVGRPSNLEPNTHIEMKLRPRWPAAGDAVFATLSHADLGVDFDTLYAPSGRTVTEDPGKYELVPREVARSANGTRLAYAAYLRELRSGSAGFLGVDATPLSFFEVIIGESPEGVIIATWRLLKDQAQCLGARTDTTTNNLLEEYLLPSPECHHNAGVRPSTTGIATDAGGTSSKTVRHDNVLLSAEYVGSELIYVEGDILQVEEHDQQLTPYSRSGYRPDDSPSCVITSESPQVLVFKRRLYQRITLRFGTHSISQDYESLATRTDVGLGVDTVSTGSTTTTTAGRSFISGPPSGKLMKFNPGHMSSATMVEGFTLFGRQLCAYPTPSTSGIAIRSPVTDPITVFYSPLLTPRGVVGVLAEETPGRLQAVTFKPLYTSCAYSPLTGEGVRAIDLTDKVPLGYL